MSYKNKINIRLEQLQDKDGIEELYGLSFSPGRYVKTVFRMREKYDHLINISHVALIGDNIIGSVRYWNILVNSSPALLLGPVVIHPNYRGEGYGKELLECSIQNCKISNFKLIFLIGDFLYYSKIGFKKLEEKKISFVGPVNKDRLLYINFGDNIIEDHEKIIIRSYKD